MDFKAAEDKVRKNWNETNQQDKIKLSRKEMVRGKWAFLDGPPFVNGSPHHGHVLVSTIKDTMARYHSQKGYEISYQIGFDCHGLPLEQKAEEKVGKVSPTDSNERIAEFNNCCREIIGNCSEVWYDVLGQLGRQFEREETYYTSSFEYMTELWKAMKQLWDKDLIYVSKKVMPYSPQCETPLSNFEANSNYKERTDISVYTRFKLKERDEYLLIWTTTPWSLLANQGICVNPELMYVLVELEGNRYWISNNAISKVFNSEVTMIEKLCYGKELEGLEYEPIFNYSKIQYKVYCDDYVKDDTGTGIVHLAPLFGEDDYRVMNISNEYLPSDLVDSQVRFLNDIDGVNLRGRFVIDTALDLTIHLKKMGHVIKSEKIVHNYPHCWRTDQPLVYLACDAWFIRVQTLIPRILENNSKINWYPKYVGTERFANWIKSAPDWCFSRNRIWGTPIPIWISESGKMKCIGDVKE
jgi:isoleucyl-tRNA synthetase